MQATAARARASHRDGFGTVEADARSGGGALASLRAYTSGEISRGSSTVETRAAASEPAPGLATARGLEGAAFATGLPSQADTLAALAGNPHVASLLASAPDAESIALMVLGGGLAADGDATAITFTSSVSFELDLEWLHAGRPLVLGLLDPEAEGEGFDVLSFAIQQDGVDILRESFVELAAALAFFDDRTLELGALAAGLENDLRLDFVLRLTSDEPGAAFRTRMILTAIPEPATAWLLGGGLVVLAWLGGQRTGNGLP